MRLFGVTVCAAVLGLFVFNMSDVNAASGSVKEPAIDARSGKTAVDTTVKDKSVKEATIAEGDFKKAGDQYAKNNQPEKAMDAYKQFMDKNPNDTANARIAKSLGELSYAKKQYSDAVKYFSMASAKNSDPLLKNMLGRSLMNSGKIKEAVDLLEPLAAAPGIKPDAQREIYKTLGDANTKLDVVYNAAAWYGKYLKAGGAKNSDVAFVMTASQRSANPAKAKLKFEENIKSYPADYRNYLHLGIMLSNNKATHQRSVNLLKKADELAGDSPDALLAIGKAYDRAGMTDDELAVLNKCLSADKGNIEARILSAKIFLKKDENADAVKLLEETNAMAPDNLESMLALAGAYYKTNKTQAAIELLIKAKSLKPKDAQVRKQLFDAYNASGQDQQAIAEIKALLEISRENEYLISYGKLLLKTGKTDEAFTVMEDVRATAPDNVEALMTYAMVLREQKKLDEAIEIYKEVSSIDDKYALALYERAETYYLQKNKVKWAEQFYKRALEADPKMAIAQLGLAKLALVYNNRPVYLELLDKAVAMDPENPLVKKELEKSKSTK